VARAPEDQLQPLALYAGNLGEAHDYRQILAAVPHLHEGGRVRFAVRGAKESDLRRDAAGFPQVEVTGYASEKETPTLLTSARVHLITMSPGWEGVVVPSKLYGCIQTGRPVLFLGPERSDTAREIGKHGWGEVLPAKASGQEVAEAIERLGRVASRDWGVEDGAKNFAGIVVGSRN